MQRNGWAAGAAALCVAGILGLAPSGAPWGSAGTVMAQEPAETPKLAANETKTTDDPPPEDEKKADLPLATNEDEVRERLETVMDVDFEDVPLADVAEYLKSQIGVQVLFCKPALDQEGISPETVVALKVQRVKASKAIDLILRNVGGGAAPLKYYLEDGLLFITTETDPRFVKRDLQVHVYNCRDLLRLESFKPEPAEGADAKAVAAKALRIVEAKLASEDASAPSAADDATSQLVEVLKTAGPADSWDDAGGVGSIRAFNGLVTIRAKRDVHENLDGLLSMLRESVQDELAK